MSLREAAQQALEALKMIDNAMPFPVAKHAIKQLSDALVEPEQTFMAEYKHRTYGYYQDADGKMQLGEMPQRKPLSDEDIVDLWADVSMDYDDQINIIEMARAIERAHGIGGEA